MQWNLRPIEYMNVNSTDIYFLLIDNYNRNFQIKPGHGEETNVSRNEYDTGIFFVFYCFVFITLRYILHLAR